MPTDPTEQTRLKIPAGGLLVELGEAPELPDSVVVRLHTDPPRFEPPDDAVLFLAAWSAWTLGSPGWGTTMVGLLGKAIRDLADGKSVEDLVAELVEGSTEAAFSKDQERLVADLLESAREIL